MREFETTFIVQPEISEEGREALLGKLDAVMSRAGGVRLELEDHGKRKLAYPIRKFQKGHYLTVCFLDEGKAVPEFERALRLEESVLRHLTIQVSPLVEDLEGRQERAAERERIRREKAAERAAREAEERAAREAEAAEREAEAAQREAEAAQRAAEEPDADDEAAEAPDEEPPEEEATEDEVARSSR